MLKVLAAGLSVLSSDVFCFAAAGCTSRRAGMGTAGVPVMWIVFDAGKLVY